MPLDWPERVRPFLSLQRGASDHDSLRVTYLPVYIMEKGPGAFMLGGAQNFSCDGLSRAALPCRPWPALHQDV